MEEKDKTVIFSQTELDLDFCIVGNMLYRNMTYEEAKKQALLDLEEAKEAEED